MIGRGYQLIDLNTFWTLTGDWNRTDSEYHEIGIKESNGNLSSCEMQFKKVG